MFVLFIMKYFVVKFFQSKVMFNISVQNGFCLIEQHSLCHSPVLNTFVFSVYLVYKVLKKVYCLMPFKN